MWDLAGLVVNTNLVMQPLNAAARYFVPDAELLGQLEAAGIKPGDRIVEAGGTAVRTLAQFTSVLQEQTNKRAEDLHLAFEQV